MGSIGGTEGLVGSASTTWAELLQELNIRGTWSGFAFVRKATTTSGRQQSTACAQPANNLHLLSRP